MSSIGLNPEGSPFEEYMRHDFFIRMLMYLVGDSHPGIAYNVHASDMHTYAS